METRKRLNIGCSDFKNIIENDNYFIDKSLFIEEVINAEKSVLLLPRPRRFGKTLNLSMLRYFFNINEPENENLFKGLKIWKSEQEIKAHRGKYPVVYLSFKDAKKNTWQGTYQHIVAEIGYAYKQHLYLLKDKLLQEFEKEKFNDILFERASEVTYEDSLKLLIEYLHRYHKQKVVILIDEYDTPIQAGYNKFYEDVIPFMRNLMSGAMKDNSNIYKGIITGILRVSRESIFTGMNNLSVHSVTDFDFSDKFGFVENEVKQILSDFNLLDKFEQVKKWYNGYNIGETTDIYNPWSILNYVTRSREGFKPYWVNTSSDELLREQLKGQDANDIREKIYTLIRKETIDKKLYENFVFPNLGVNTELIWTLLVFSGYLTFDKKLSVDEYSLRIPNNEISFVFKNIIIDWLNLDVKIKQSLLIETTKQLINNEIEKFQKGFKKIIGDVETWHATSLHTKGEPENVYQSYVSVC